MTSRTIPAPIKRAIRQASAFGCVICGMPIYHYEHIEDFSETQAHVPADMVLLCPNHHQEKTSGRLSRDTIRKFQAAPFNQGHDTTASHIVLLTGDAGRLIAGGNIFEFSFRPLNDRFDAVVVSNVSVLALEYENGFLLLDLHLSDRTGRTLLKVTRGELVISTEVWDFTLEGTLLTIRSAARSVDLRLRFADNGVTIERGQFLIPPRGILIEPDHVVLLPSRNRLSGSIISQCRFGLTA